MLGDAESFERFDEQELDMASQCLWNGNADFICVYKSIFQNCILKIGKRFMARNEIYLLAIL